jgi:DDB1- and CUL4-associated factor 13
MKVQTLKRTTGTVERECSGDLRRQARNLDPQYHPMQRAREYTRAVTAAKISRMFAKPLVGNLGHGHRDAVTCSAVSRRSLVPLVSGSSDGSLMLWDLASRTTVAAIETAHSRTVTGLTFAVNGQSFYSCSDDGYIHRWNIHASRPDDEDAPDSLDRKQSSKVVSAEPSHGPTLSWRTAGSFKSIDHHWMDDQVFATASDSAVQVWTPQRSTAVSTFTDLWGSDDTVTTVRFNPSERSLLAHCSADRGIGLHDTRTAKALKKTILSMRSNDLAWNPMEPMVFAVANEDFNTYTFDMRQLDKPMRIYKGHTGAVMSVAWAPTGREFVTGSYDRTIRIFPVSAGQSRDIYHTKRMQRVWTVQYSADNTWIISGSDDSNLRLWKAISNEQLGQLTTREEAAQQYRSALIKRYEHLPEVRKIAKARKIPKVIQNQTKQFQIQKESAARKQTNRVKYSKNGEHKFVSERKKVVVKEIE